MMDYNQFIYKLTISSWLDDKWIMYCKISYAKLIMSMFCILVFTWITFIWFSLTYQHQNGAHTYCQRIFEFCSYFHVGSHVNVYAFQIYNEHIYNSMHIQKNIYLLGHRNCEPIKINAMAGVSKWNAGDGQRCQPIQAVFPKCYHRYRQFCQYYWLNNTFVLLHCASPMREQIKLNRYETPVAIWTSTAPSIYFRPLVYLSYSRRKSPSLSHPLSAFKTFQASFLLF